MEATAAEWLINFFVVKAVDFITSEDLSNNVMGWTVLEEIICVVCAF